MRDRVFRWLRRIGYPAFFTVCFFTFFTWSFPYDRLKDRIEATFNERQARTTAPQELHIDEVSSYWISGVRAKGVRLVTPSSEKDKPPTELKIDEARVRVSILPLLIGNRHVSFGIDVADGTVKGSYAERGKDRSIDMTLDNLDIGRIDPIVALLGVPMDGRINGTVKFELPEGKASKATGDIKLTAESVAVGDGKAKIKGLLALPKLTVGELALEAQAKDGNLKIAKLSAGGSDVELKGDGRVLLRENVNDDYLDVNVSFKVNDGYRNKSDQTKSLFGSPGSKVPPLFELDPKISRSKRSDGFYAFHLRGPLGKPDSIPMGDTARGGSSGGSGSPFAFPGGAKPALPGLGGSGPSSAPTNPGDNGANP